MAPHNAKHWSNTEETLKLLQEVILPYAQETKRKLGLAENHKSLIIWDDFRAHTTSTVLNKAKELNFVIAEVPKNLTHLLAPLDLTVNKSLKTLEGREVSVYYSEAIAKYIRLNPTAPIEDAKVDIRMSVIKPLHAKTMHKAYQFFSAPEGRKVIVNGFRSAGIQEAVTKARDSAANAVADLIDPFSNLALQ